MNGLDVVWMALTGLASFAMLLAVAYAAGLLFGRSRRR
jgi:hypothetical protein